MSRTLNLTKNIFFFLNKNSKYAVLRNFEGLPEDNASRDIDIVINHKDLKKTLPSLIRLIDESGWRIVTYLNNGRLITLVCGIIHNNKTELIQWDFFLNTSVYGIMLIEAEELLEEREFNGTLYHVSKSYEFLDKYIYNRVVGEDYPSKYQTLRDRVGKSEKVKIKLKKIFGDDNIEVIDNMKKKDLLKKVFLCNIKNHFFRTFGYIIKSQWLYLSSFLSSNIAVSLSFTGPDGAGKTTVIDLLKKDISSVFEKSTNYYHFRPELFPNLGDAANSSGIKKVVDRDYSNPHRSRKKGVLNSFVRLCYYTLDYSIGFWIKVKPHCRLTKFIIFDRYYTDIISDSRRSCIDLSTKFLYYWGKLFIPRMNYNILLTADKDLILARKQELTAEGIVRINNKLEYLSKKRGYYLVLNNRGPEDAIQNILTFVFEEQHKKNIKRIG